MRRPCALLARFTSMVGFDEGPRLFGEAGRTVWMDDLHGYCIRRPQAVRLYPGRFPATEALALREPFPPLTGGIALESPTMAAGAHRGPADMKPYRWSLSASRAHKAARVTACGDQCLAGGLPLPPRLGADTLVSPRRDR